MEEILRTISYIAKNSVMSKKEMSRFLINFYDMNKEEADAAIKLWETVEEIKGWC